MKVKTKSGLSFELAKTSNKKILALDSLLGKA
jgi:tRNA A37 N6-isopentenylltransferase MiaA